MISMQDFRFLNLCMPLPLYGVSLATFYFHSFTEHLKEPFDLMVLNPIQASCIQPMASQHKLSLFCSWASQIDCEMKEAKDQNKVVVIVAHRDLINKD